MTKTAFQSSTKRWLLALLIATLALPAFLLVGAIPGVCVHPQGACFGASIILMFWVVPIAVVACLLMLLWTIGRRVKGLGLSTGWIVAVVVWCFAAGPAAIFGGLGMLSTAMIPRLSPLAHVLMSPAMTFILFLLAFIAFLWRAEPDDAHPDDANRQMAWTVAAIAAAHVTILHAGGVLSYPVLIIGAVLRPLLDVLRAMAAVASLGMPYPWTALLGWIDFAVFGAALAYILRFRSGEQGGGDIAPVAGAGPLSGAQRATFGRRTR